jgi:predicted lipoprotein with Yx(FWY)xxD motif
LTGLDGKTLYISAGDSPNTSTCTGPCATTWPPLIVTPGHLPTVGAGVTGKLGTFTRADGTTQVSYNGMPLYYWQGYGAVFPGDAKPGDVTGQNIDGFIVAKP